jgi:hypothetical protein
VAFRKLNRFLMAIANAFCGKNPFRTGTTRARSPLVVQTRRLASQRARPVRPLLPVAALDKLRSIEEFSLEGSRNREPARFQAHAFAQARPVETPG